jgi:hypothetical protein
MSNYQRKSYRHKYQQRWCSEKSKLEIEEAELIIHKRIEKAFTDYGYNGLPITRLQCGIEYANALCIPEYTAREFKHALDFTTRVIDEKLLFEDHELVKRNYNMYVADNYRAYTYVRAILGISNDMSLLREAAICNYRDHFPTKASFTPRDPLGQQLFLHSIHMALLGQEYDLAAEWLAKAHKFTQHAPEVRLLTTFMNNELNNRWDDNRQFQDEYDEFFDLCRNYAGDTPDFFTPRSSCYHFEMAVLRDKYLIAEDHQINWQRALLSVGE